MRKWVNWETSLEKRFPDRPRTYESFVEALRETYRDRRDTLCGGLAAAGYDVLTPDATFYCLVACPAGVSSMAFAARLLAEAHVVATPATGR